MESEEDKENHQGIEYQSVNFDELTQFTITQYLYLFSRLRSPIEGLVPSMRATTNPTGTGLVWVRKRFIGRHKPEYAPGKTYWWLPGEDPIENPAGTQTFPGNPDAVSRAFIPGQLAENKILMDNDPMYARNIKLMGMQYEQALLHGDWWAFGGEFFPDFSHDLGVEPFKIPHDWVLYGSLDPGWSSPCSFGLHAIAPDGTKYRIFTYYARKLSAREHAKNVSSRIHDLEWTDGRLPQFVVAGHDAWLKKPGRGGEEISFFDEFLNYDLHLVRAKTDRVAGWWAMKGMMRRKQWLYFRDMNDDIVDEITSSSPDEREPEDLLGKGRDPEVNDHALDEDRYGCMAREFAREQVPEVKIHKEKRFGGADELGPTEKADPRKFW
jgi:hypothetical protein